MNICYITTTVHLSKDLDEGLGSTTHTYAIAKELTRLGNTVHVISEKWKDDSDFEEIDKIKVHRLLRGILVSSAKVKASKFRGLLKRFKFLGNFFLALKISKIAREQNCDIILERAQSKIGWFVALLTGKPLCVQVVDNLYSKRSLQKAKRVFAHSTAFFDDKLVEKVVLLSAGYDPAIFGPVAAKARYDLCYAGSFKEWDGLEELIEAVKLARGSNPKIKALLVGNGTNFDKIRNLINENSLEKNFVLTGKVPLAEVSGLMAQSKICVAPFNIKNYSKADFQKYGYYFSPLKVIEYMAAGKPVIASNYETIAESLEDKNQLFAPGNVKGLAEKIGSFLKSGNLKRIGTENLARARKFEWAKVVKRMDEEMRKAVAGGARPFRLPQ